MHDDAFQLAYTVAVQAAAAAAARNLYASEITDPEVGAVMIECNGPDVAVTLLGKTGAPIGGYSL